MIWFRRLSELKGAAARPLAMTLPSGGRLFEAPAQTLTATAIAAAAGYARYTTAIERFSKLARSIAEDLGYEPETKVDGTAIWTTTLATQDDTGADDPAQWRWKLRPEVDAALRQLGWFAGPAVVAKAS